MIHWVPLLGGLLAVNLLSVNGSNDPVYALWPQQTNATLSLSVDEDGLSIVKASDGGTLGTFDIKFNTGSEILLDPLLSTIEIVWVPARDARSSTFDRFWTNSQRFDGINAEGIHLQTKLRDEGSWNFVNETVHERIEENIRNILHIVLPSIDILPQLSRGFLAKSLCGFHSWMARNPLQESLHESTDKSSSLCYASSFPLSAKNESITFFNRMIRVANGGSVDSLKSVAERTVLENKQSFYTGQREHCLAVVKLGRSPVSSAMIEAEILEVWVSQSDKVQAPWVATLPVRETKSDILVVTSIDRELGLDKLEYAWVQRDGKPGAPGVAPSVFEVQIAKTAVAASIQAAIVGEGFHRRYVMDVELLDNEVCGKTTCDKTVLMLVPVSRTVYLDLDELRRMERFGDLKLASFTKHIEIERPSVVSSQHVVGLEFTMPTTNQAHIEFPLHFRYQAPSETDLYRHASVIAPDLFLVCPSGDRSVKRKLKSSNDDAIQSYFQTWGLTRLPDPASGDHHWLRLTTISPIPVIDVPVPVGYLPSAWLVSSVTLLFASMGAALLLWVSIGVAKTAQGSTTSNDANWKRKTQ
ncbi:unnamed protein product [Peronospora farinosa]|uniref:Phosphatidylinositol-glycan biosynthesis class X protein n=1 Tax=Peronospora farinosa TaxID=134698 RepID=A0AAV0TAL9_9STRA|nr:unnamed protein product [Peronospora farinosa]CAI5716505.1 unnamed protein product [Peronospora farinosa]